MFFRVIEKMNNNFMLYKNTKDLSFEIMEFSKNIPKNMVVLKNNMQSCLDNAVKLIHYYVVNMNDNPRIKNKYLKDLVVELSMVDYYLESLYRSKNIGKEKYNYFCNLLEEIRKLTYGVIKSEKMQDTI